MSAFLTLSAMIFGLWFFSLLSAADGLRIPLEGEFIIDRPITITSDVLVDGPGRLVIEQDGGIIVDGGDVTIAGIEIEWRAGSDPVRPAIEQRGGKLSLVDNRIIIRITPQRADPQASGAQWFLRVEGQFRGGSLIVDGNDVNGQIRYGAGFLHASNLTNFSPVSITRNSVAKVHGGIYLSAPVKAEVFGNRLDRVTYGNIVLDEAEKTVVEMNSIIVPGDGTAGDGMTIAGGIDNVIRGNRIMFGSCYGIQVLPGSDGVDNLEIDDNVIAGGITSAIMVRGEADKPVRGLNITRNVINSNRGWALFADFVTNLRFEDNAVSDNAARDGFQHLLGEVSLSRWSGNVSATRYTNEAVGSPSLLPAQEYPAQ